MSDRMCIACFDGEGRLSLRDIPLDQPGPGEVVVEVRAAGVCGSDLHQFLGRWPRPEYAAGHEVAGVVKEVGPGVTDVAPGDRVCVEPFLYCGECRYCMHGRYFQCPDMGFLTLTAHGGFAQFLIAPCHALYRLPDTVSLEVGALAEPLAVAVHAARLASVCGADDVLVLGAGTIGLMAVAAARHMGSPSVYITARHPHQAEAAMRLGAKGALSTDTATLKEEIADRFLRGPEVILEAVGSDARTFQQAVDVAGRLGRIALMGANTGPMDDINLAPVIKKELVIYGSGCYSQIDTRRDFEIAVSILAADPEVFESMITHRLPLAEIQTAFETALDRGKTKAIKVMIVA